MLAGMNRTFALAIAGAAVLAAAPAHADWEKTRWGDPVEKVVAKAGPGAEPFAGTEKQRVFDQDYRARRRGEMNGVAVEWQFFFDPKGGLSVVKIIPQDYANCPAFLTMIRGTVGQPIGGKVQTLGSLELKNDQFNDKPKNLAIMVLEAFNPNTGMRLCHITYQSYGDGKPGMRS